MTSKYSEQETPPVESGKWKNTRTENVRERRKELKGDGKEKCMLSGRECPDNGTERRANELGK